MWIIIFHQIQYDHRENQNIHNKTLHSVVLEYCKNAMTVLKKNYVTNFYLANRMNGLGHGYDRYKILEAVLSFREDATSMTQWSVIYDLTEYSAIFTVRREYDKQSIFKGKSF